MKNRHVGRELALTTLYALDFNKTLAQGVVPSEFPAMSEEETAKLDPEAVLFARFLLAGTLEHLDEVDDWITRFSINRPLDRIDIIDRNILRISVFSMLFVRDIHSNVVITEAVQLSQEYSREVNYKFINGMLDSMRKEIDDYLKNS